MTSILDLVQGIALPAVTQERLRLKDEQFRDIERQRNEVRERLREQAAEISQLKAENAALKRRISDLEIPGQLTMHNGVFWNRKPQGGYETMPYCPKCRHVMMDWEETALCASCNIKAPSLQLPA